MTIERDGDRYHLTCDVCGGGEVGSAKWHGRC